MKHDASPTTADYPRYCPRCGRIDMRHRWELKRWDEEPCHPNNCSVWKVIGKSKSGGPLLRIVDDAGQEQYGRP